MAKKSRDSTNIDALPSVKLFAGSCGWPYKPRWSVESPLIFLFGGAAEDPEFISKAGHICSRSKELMCSLLRPQHDDVFIIDLSQLATRSEWRTELERPGRASKMLSKWFMKFNPSAATVVVQGMDVGLIEGIIRSWSTPATSPVDRPVERVIVTGKAPNKKSMQSLAEMCKVEVVKPTTKALAISLERSKHSDEKPAEVELADLIVVSVEFSLDPVSKSLLQTPIDISAKILADTTPISLPTGESAENDLATSERVATHHLDFGMTVRSMIVQVVDIQDAGGMIHAVLSDAHGSVEALLSDSAQVEATRGSIVAVSGRVVSLQGRLILLVEEARAHNKLQRGYCSVRMGQRNLSQRTHLYGCLVLRGSKCILARSHDSALIPVTQPRAYESRQQAATRAVAETCKIYAEELALVHDVPPAVAYLNDVDGKGPVVLTVFLAVATSEAQKDTCGCDDVLDSEKEKLWDWYDFEQAVSFVNLKAERACILNLTGALASAVNAGVVIFSSPGAFGPKVHAINGDLSLHQLLALTPMDGPKGMLSDSKDSPSRKSTQEPPSRKSSQDSSKASPKSAASDDKDSWTCCDNSYRSGKMQFCSPVSTQGPPSDDTGVSSEASVKTDVEGGGGGPYVDVRRSPGFDLPNMSLAQFEKAEKQKKSDRMAKKGGGCCGGKCGPGCC